MSRKRSVFSSKHDLELIQKLISGNKQFGYLIPGIFCSIYSNECWRLLLVAMCLRPAGDSGNKGTRGVCPRHVLGTTTTTTPGPPGVLDPGRSVVRKIEDLSLISTTTIRFIAHPNKKLSAETCGRVQNFLPARRPSRTLLCFTSW